MSTSNLFFVFCFFILLRQPTVCLGDTGVFGRENQKFSRSPITFLQDTLHLHLRKLDPENQKQIEAIKGDIQRLLQQLDIEERNIEVLRQKKIAMKHGSWTWFFEPETRRKIDAVQLEINDQLRRIENVIDDINFQMKMIKPLYGVFSQMFLLESLGFIPFFMELVVALVRLFLLFDLLSLIIFGPMALLVMFFWLSLGVHFFLSLLSVLFWGVSLYWIMFLPFVIIQYEPTIAEFLVVYVPFVSVFFLLSAYVFGVFSKRSSSLQPPQRHPTARIKID